MDTIKISFRTLRDNPLARNSAVVFAGSMAANVLSYLYHLIMGRILGPSGYGELSSLLSLLYIFTVPLLVTQLVLVKFISSFKAHGELGQTKALFVKSVRYFAVLSVVLFPIALVAAPWVTSFLHLSSTTLFIMVYLLLVISLFTIVSSSVLTGYQKFVWVSIMGAVSILVKLIISIPFAAWRVPGVMIASVLAGIIVYGFYFFPLKFMFGTAPKPTNIRKRDAFGFAVPTLLMQLGITSLYSTDIILVRHFFSAQEAGLYAALAILGKIIFYASSAVPTVLFPIASERSASGGRTRKLVLSAAGAVAVISAGIALFYFLFPKFVVGLLFGNSYVGAAPLLGIFAVFLGLFSLGNTLSMANIAVGKTRVWIAAVVAALVQIIGIWVFHATIVQVIILDIAVAALFTAGALINYFYEKV